MDPHHPFCTALEMKPDVPVIYCNRALCYMKLGQYPEALTDARRAVQLEVKNVKAHYIVGKVLCESGDVYEAEKCLMKGTFRCYSSCGACFRFLSR
jgi:tetratricopeptide (TPR) repeat protein